MITVTQLTPNDSAGLTKDKVSVNIDMIQHVGDGFICFRAVDSYKHISGFRYDIMRVEESREQLVNQISEARYAREYARLGAGRDFDNTN